MNAKGLVNAFKIPIEQLDTPHFELNGTAQFLADGCLGILHYDENKVCLNCGSEIVEIEGSNLSLNHLGDNEAEVKGHIQTVKFV